MSSIHASQVQDQVRWRLFLRALASELDGALGAEERDALLRRVGARMARGAALPPVDTLDALQAEINDVLADIGWGEAGIELDEASRALRIVHAGLPAVGSLAGPRGGWLSAVLEGLYTVWLGQQPDAQAGLEAHRDAPRADGAVGLTYARAAGGRPPEPAEPGQWWQLRRSPQRRRP